MAEVHSNVKMEPTGPKREVDEIYRAPEHLMKIAYHVYTILEAKCFANDRDRAGVALYQVSNDDQGVEVAFAKVMDLNRHWYWDFLIHCWNLGGNLAWGPILSSQAKPLKNNNLYVSFEYDASEIRMAEYWEHLRGVVDYLAEFLKDFDAIYSFGPSATDALAVQNFYQQVMQARFVVKATLSLYKMINQHGCTPSAMRAEYVQTLERWQTFTWRMSYPGVDRQIFLIDDHYLNLLHDVMGVTNPKPPTHLHVFEAPHDPRQPWAYWEASVHEYPYTDSHLNMLCDAASAPYILKNIAFHIHCILTCKQHAEHREIAVAAVHKNVPFTGLDPSHSLYKRFQCDCALLGGILGWGPVITTSANFDFVTRTDRSRKLHLTKRFKAVLDFLSMFLRQFCMVYEYIGSRSIIFEPSELLTYSFHQQIQHGDLLVRFILDLIELVTKQRDAPAADRVMYESFLLPLGKLEWCFQREEQKVHIISNNFQYLLSRRPGQGLKQRVWSNTLHTTLSEEQIEKLEASRKEHRTTRAYCPGYSQWIVR